MVTFFLNTSSRKHLWSLCMNRGKFLKEKVINFTKFLTEYSIDLPDVESMPDLLIWTTMETHLQHMDTELLRDKRDVASLLEQLGTAKSALDLKQILAQVSDKYEEMPLVARDKFWRYLECFHECINSEPSQ